MKNERIVIGISGASGSKYALRLIEILISMPYEIHLIISGPGMAVLKHELKLHDMNIPDIVADFKKNGSPQADIIIHDNNDLFASVASGSFQTKGMIIIPCSMKTLSSVANGYGSALLERAADVTLKEKRTLILVTRETPLGLIHLKNMVAAAVAGATIMPASPGFYHHPKSIDDLLDFVTARILDHLHIEPPNALRWKDN